MVQHLKHLERSVIHLLLRLSADLVSAHGCEDKHVHGGYVWPYDRHMCLVVNESPLLIRSLNSLELLAADSISSRDQICSLQRVEDHQHDSHSCARHNHVESSEVTKDLK